MIPLVVVKYHRMPVELVERVLEDAKKHLCTRALLPAPKKPPGVIKIACRKPQLEEMIILPVVSLPVVSER